MSYSATSAKQEVKVSCFKCNKGHSESERMLHVNRSLIEDREACERNYQLSFARGVASGGPQKSRQCRNSIRYLTQIRIKNIAVVKGVSKGHGGTTI